MKRSKQIERNASILQQGAALFGQPKKNDVHPGHIRKVVADFINTRLPIDTQVTPDWIAANPAMAKRVVDMVRHQKPLAPGSNLKSDDMGNGPPSVRRKRR